MVATIISLFTAGAFLWPILLGLPNALKKATETLDEAGFLVKAWRRFRATLRGEESLSLNSGQDGEAASPSNPEGGTQALAPSPEGDAVQLDDLDITSASPPTTSHQ
ncbi:MULTISPECIES: hypothetical protein [unclassified Streptomyces]|uniref:hypothetical protein n=1 Tax=unclassified Streptomyces TaxID=2593676 RepID=UPI002E11776E|nr:hypothetical protein OG452_24560 [Streptomyces sp. NBC_01197]WSS49069.1 hypothetical protein OG708_10670 [Streptomyces sp. NBC_01180]